MREADAQLISRIMSDPHPRVVRHLPPMPRLERRRIPSILVPGIDSVAVQVRMGGPMDRISFIRKMLGSYASHSGMDPHTDHAIVVDVGVAHILMREMMFMLPKGVLISEEADALFDIDGIPVVLRINAPHGSAFVMLISTVPPRSCCDASAMMALMICLGRGANA